MARDPRAQAADDSEAVQGAAISAKNGEFRPFFRVADQFTE
jgi:hypothetical protein